MKKCSSCNLYFDESIISCTKCGGKLSDEIKVEDNVYLKGQLEDILQFAKDKANQLKVKFNEAGGIEMVKEKAKKFASKISDAISKK